MSIPVSSINSLNNTKLIKNNILTTKAPNNIYTNPKMIDTRNHLTSQQKQTIPSSNNKSVPTFIPLLNNTSNLAQPYHYQKTQPNNQINNRNVNVKSAYQSQPPIKLQTNLVNRTPVYSCSQELQSKIPRHLDYETQAIKKSPVSLETVRICSPSSKNQIVQIQDEVFNINENPLSIYQKNAFQDIITDPKYISNFNHHIIDPLTQVYQEVTTKEEQNNQNSIEIQVTQDNSPQLVVPIEGLEEFGENDQLLTTLKSQKQAFSEHIKSQIDKNQINEVTIIDQIQGHSTPMHIHIEPIPTQFINPTVSSSLRSPVPTSIGPLSRSSLSKTMDRLRGRQHQNFKVMNTEPNINEEYSNSNHGQSIIQQIQFVEEIGSTPTKVLQSPSKVNHYVKNELVKKQRGIQNSAPQVLQAEYNVQHSSGKQVSVQQEILVPESFPPCNSDYLRGVYEHTDQHLERKQTQQILNQGQLCQNMRQQIRQQLVNLNKQIKVDINKNSPALKGNNIDKDSHHKTQKTNLIQNTPYSVSHSVKDYIKKQDKVQQNKTQSHSVQKQQQTDITQQNSRLGGPYNQKAHLVTETLDKNKLNYGKISQPLLFSKKINVGLKPINSNINNIRSNIMRTEPHVDISDKFNGYVNVGVPRIIQSPMNQKRAYYQSSSNFIRSQQK